MAIQYILGRAGSGKSHRILQEIKQSLQDGGDDLLILLVPEQFTLQSERDLIQKLNLPGIMRVEVLSFSRLAQRVFNDVGGLTRTLLNEQGKNMVLRKMIDETARELTIYKKAAQQDGFIPKFNELLSELKQQDINPDQLRAAVNGEEEIIIKQKINDIALIYEHFNEYLEGRYLDIEDYFNLFVEKIEGAEFLKNSRIWLDGFTTFSPQSLKIIDKIMFLARDITISLTLDNNHKIRDRELFGLTRRSFQKIQTMAQEHGLSEKIICLNSDAAKALKRQEIVHLESELYAYPIKPYRGGVQSLEIFAAANIYSEVEHAAAQIVTLARDRGWRWKDIAVVCNDMSSYSSLIKRVFNEYGIPCFMDQKRDIMNNSIIKLVLSSVDIIRRGYRYEDIFSFLKTGFSGLDDDETEKLENFVLRYGIQGQKWKEDFSLDNKESLEELNRWRAELIVPLQKLEQNLSGKKPVSAIIRAHYEYLLETGVQNRLEKWIDKMNAQGCFEIVRENTQIWNVILDIFDQMVEILGDQEISLKEYPRLLEAGFISLELGIIPTTIDQVLVGNIQRSKSHDIRGLLVVGANDGLLPSGQEEESILSETEKEMLMDRGVDIGFERNKKFAEERFLIYTALSKPLEYLGVSFAMADGAGKALRPSLLIDRFKRLYPGLKISSDVIKSRAAELFNISTPASSYKYLVEKLRLHLDGKDVQDFWQDVYSWYHGQEYWQERLNLTIEGLFHHNQADNIGADNARGLYSLPLHSTVSRVEQFVNCPFAHFVRYGLKAQERKIFAVGAPDIGELFHNSLLSFALKLRRENKDWLKLQRSECESIMDSIMDELVPQHGHGVFASTHRYQYLVQRLKRISRRAVWILTEHLQQGGFEPLQYEVSFGPGCTFPAIEIELGDGEKFYLVGRIDRVDLLESEEGTYVKIIDYKSGNQDFKLSDVYNGLSLQLMIYLRAVLASSHELKRGKLKPAGVFYFKIDDPLINSESGIIENIEKEIAKKLKMKGLVLEDTQLVRQLDNNITGSSEIIPVTLTTDGGFAKSSSVLLEEDLTGLIRHVESLLRRIGREIMNGKVKIEPIKNGQHTACTFCSYRSICQFDRQLKDNNYRNIRSLKNEEVVTMIQVQKEAASIADMD